MEIISAGTIEKHVHWQSPLFVLVTECRCTENAISQSWGWAISKVLENWEMFVAGLSGFVCPISSGSHQSMNSFPPKQNWGGTNGPDPLIVVTTNAGGGCGHTRKMSFQNWNLSNQNYTCYFCIIPKSKTLDDSAEYYFGQQDWMENNVAADGAVCLQLHVANNFLLHPACLWFPCHWITKSVHFHLSSCKWLWNWRQAMGNF